MKIFPFTLLLLLCLLAFICFNYIYVNKASSELALDAAKLTPSTDELEALSRKWEKKRRFIAFSVGEPRLDIINDLIDTLKVCASLNEHVEFERARALLVNAFEGISEFESLSPSSIF